VIVVLFFFNNTFKKDLIWYCQHYHKRDNVHVPIIAQIMLVSVIQLSHI